MKAVHRLTLKHHGSLSWESAVTTKTPAGNINTDKQKYASLILKLQYMQNALAMKYKKAV